MKRKYRFTLGSFSSKFSKKSMTLKTPLNIRFSFLGDIWYFKRQSGIAQLKSELLRNGTVPHDYEPTYTIDYDVSPPENLLSKSEKRKLLKAQKKAARSGKRGGGLIIASIFLIAAAIVMYILAERISNDEVRITPTDTPSYTDAYIDIDDGETVTEDIAEYSCISNVNIDVSESINTVSINAEALCDEGHYIDKLHVSVVTTGGEPVYSEELAASEGVWEFEKPAMTCIITVTAHADNGTERSAEYYLYPQENVFIWPVTPEYVPLIHDYYHINTGSKYMYTYTHNNGEQREKHYVFGISRYHYGFDITANPDSDVLAMGDGTVVSVATNIDSTGSTGYGKYIIIRHSEKLEGQPVYALYAHLSKATVKRGDKVKQGQVIGLSGNTGGSRIPHLHLEIRIGGNDKNYCVDPLEVLPSVSFENLKTQLSTADGFMDSSVDLYSAMLDGGWDYSVFALAKTDITLDNGIFIPQGSELEIITRSDSKIVCIYDEQEVTLKTSQLVYTYNYPDTEA